MNAVFMNGANRMGLLLRRLEVWILVALVAVLAGFSLVQIILRNFFGTGILWGETLLRHLVLWVSLLGAVRATSENKHIQIDLLPRLLPRRFVYAAAVITSLFSMIVSIVLCYASWRFVEGERLAGGYAFAQVPYWWLEVIFPLAFALMSIRFGFRTVHELVRGAGGLEEEGR